MQTFRGEWPRIFWKIKDVEDKFGKVDLFGWLGKNVSQVFRNQGFEVEEELLGVFYQTPVMFVQIRVSNEKDRECAKQILNKIQPQHFCIN